MKQKLTDVKVLYVHDQGLTVQIKIAGLADGLESVEKTIDVNSSQEAHERFLLILSIARLTGAAIKSITIEGSSLQGLSI